MTLDSPPNLNSFVDILRWRASSQPTKKAYTYLVDGESQEVTLTYLQLYQQAHQVARLLRSHQLEGSRALLLYPPGLSFVSAFFGCLLAGVIAIPAYPPRRNRSIERIQAIVEDSQAAVVLSTSELSGKFSQQFAQDSELARLKTLTTDNLAETSDVDTVAVQLESNLSGEHGSSSDVDLEIDKDALAFLQYTSGSTGKPKGVMVSHANLLQNSADLDRGWDHTPDSVVVTWLPTFHDMGLIYGVLQPLYKGIPCYMLSPTHFLQKPFRWLQAISKYRGTHSAGPNFAYANCSTKIKPEQKETLDLSCWKMALNGAEPVRADTLQQFAQTFKPYGFRADAFCPGYGLAEATLKVAAARANTPLTFCQVDAQALAINKVVYIDEPKSGKTQARSNSANENSQTETQTLVGCGWTDIDTQILIVDPKTGRVSRENTIGEIWVGGETVAQGYWQRPEETERVFRAHLKDTGEGPFLRTGDLGFVRKGELFVTGRLKDLMIIRGRNHYPQDVELAVERSNPALRSGHGAAFSVTAGTEEQLVVVQEVERSYLRKLDSDAVIKDIRKAISAEHQLQVLAAVLIKTGNIPKTSSGKIQRRLCKQKFLSGELTVVGMYRAERS